MDGSRIGTDPLFHAAGILNPSVAGTCISTRLAFGAPGISPHSAIYRVHTASIVCWSHGASRNPDPAGDVVQALLVRKLLIC